MILILINILSITIADTIQMYVGLIIIGYIAKAKHRIDTFLYHYANHVSVCIY